MEGKSFDTGSSVEATRTTEGLSEQSANVFNSVRSIERPDTATKLSVADTVVLPAPCGADLRPSVRGKFIFIGDEKLYVRGVTYGTFHPREDGDEYPGPEIVEQDFALMTANGLNAVRTYTVPPRWLLDAAQRHRLHVMVGVPVERYVGFLTDKKGAPDLEGLVRAGVRACAGHPAILCYVIGNEIPASSVSWLGRRRTESYLERLH